MFKTAISAALLASAIISPATAQEDRSRIVSCKFVVDGREMISGPCRFTPDGRDGSFQIMSRNGQYFAQVLMSGQGIGEGYWNGEPYAGHAHSSLGTLYRQEACWVNDVASVCAW